MSLNPNLNLNLNLATRLDFPVVLNQLQLHGIYVEIGTYKGEFSAHLLAHTTPRKLYCVDPYTCYPEYLDAMNTEMTSETIFTIAKETLRLYPNVEFIREHADTASRHFKDESVDFCYIDGNHTYKYVMLDLEKW